MLQDFSSFLCTNCNSSETGQPSLSQQPPSKNWDPVKPFGLKIETLPLVGDSSPSSDTLQSVNLANIYLHLQSQQ